MRSGLRRRCAAVASWQAEIPIVDVQEVVGILPPRAIGELLVKVADALPPPSVGPTSRPGDPEVCPSGVLMTSPRPTAEDGQEQSADEIA